MPELPAVVPSDTCRAPHVALRFSPDGHVHACCVNDKYPLGRVGEQSLRDIWDGARLARLREAIDVGDYRLGCLDCEVDHQLGERLHTHAEQYDRYPQPEEPLVWPRRVEFALSNTCNLQCVQCNGELSSAIRAQREHRPPLPDAYGDAFFAELPELLPHIEVAVFIGGEPFLSRACRKVWDLMIEMDVHPEVHVTTNGTVWDERVEHYLHSLRMIVAVSMDGASAEVNDAIRLGSDFSEVVANRDRFLDATRSYGGAFCLNHCLLRDNWHELGPFLLEADELDVGVHVIPVHYPPRLSLFTLPLEEISVIAETLETSGYGERLVRNLPVWEDMVSHVRAYAGVAGGATPVTLRRYPAPEPVPVRATVEPAAAVVEPPRPLDEAGIARVRSELEVWSGQDVLVMRAPNGTVEAVDVPDWARPLDPTVIVGTPIEDVGDFMAPRLGPRSDLRIDPEDGFLRVSYTHHPRGAVLFFRSVVVPYWGVLTATQATSLVLEPVAG